MTTLVVVLLLLIGGAGAVTWRHPRAARRMGTRALASVRMHWLTRPGAPFRVDTLAAGLRCAAHRHRAVLAHTLVPACWRVEVDEDIARTTATWGPDLVAELVAVLTTEAAAAGYLFAGGRVSVRIVASPYAGWRIVPDYPHFDRPVTADPAGDTHATMELDLPTAQLGAAPREQWH